MLKMTEVQSDFLADVKRFVEENRLQVPNASLLGEHELYVLLDFEICKVFLYNDGEANIQSAPSKRRRAIDLRYELAEYKNVSLIKETFFHDLKKVLSEEDEC